MEVELNDILDNLFTKRADNNMCESKKQGKNIITAT